MQDNFPVLVSCKPLKPDFTAIQEINITSESFKIGRSLQNDVVLPHLCISRNHCSIQKLSENEWFIEDFSSVGVEVNGVKVGKGKKRKLTTKDIISLEPTGEFVYKFMKNSVDDFESPRKKFKPDKDESVEMLNNVKMKFEESQNCEIKHIQDKIQNAKQMQATSMVLKEQLQLEMNRKVEKLESKFQLQIVNLKGEKDEVERQKRILIEERDMQLASVKNIMETQIKGLMEQIKKHNETESELLNENNFLKENLQREREEFLAELNRESSSKNKLLDKLESKIKEQEEIRLKERNELKEMLLRETEQLRVAKEMELRELEEQKIQKELELQKELEEIKQNMKKQIERTEHEKQIAEQMLHDQIEKMKKLNDEDKARMNQLVQERAEIQKQLIDAQDKADRSIEKYKNQVTQRETELAALAADRIQKQADQSGEVISSLQQQLERVRNQLHYVESEKNTLLENISMTDATGEGTSKQIALAEVNDLMETELQCSICAELFISATTLNCSHTFCKYCIDTWKKKKKECPNCRTRITSECKSLALDTFIEKMVQNLSEDVKKKREELLKFREELEKNEKLKPESRTKRRNSSNGNNEEGGSHSDVEQERWEEEESEYDEGEYRDFEYEEYDSDDGFNWDSDDDTDGEVDGAGDASDSRAGRGRASAHMDRTGGREGDYRGGGERRGGRRVAGRAGAFYGGYGRCFSCGSLGHWAPGCPFR